jgi:ubiquinone/menaquinone biosynthesis C-methylase UbiE
MSDPHVFKVRDASSYDDVTDMYDYYTELFTRPLALEILGLARYRSTDRLLDVATGTGIVSLLAAKTTAGGGEVVGVDLSDGMLRKTRAKAAADGLTVTLLKSDAEALELPDCSFDVVVSLFGLMHFPHPEKAIGEMFRVVRPGGRVVIGVGASPAMFTAEQFRHALDRLHEEFERARGRWLSAPALIDSLVRKHVPPLAEPETSPISRSKTHAGTYLPRMMRGAGFVDLSRSWKGFAPRLATPEEFWDVQSTFSSVARKRLAHATAAQVAAVKEDFLRACEAVTARGGRMVYRYGAFFVAGQRPNA